ncbi:MAG: hypothetical protein O7G88_07030 [bacterium]|nr:hypothetical protein [bacterium]
MSEQTTSFVWVVFSGLLMIVLGLLLWTSQPFENPSGIERALTVPSVCFGLFLLFKQRWALIGANLTLLIGIMVFFSQTWVLPIMAEDASLIWPSFFKMLIGIALFVLLGRDRIEQSFFMR